MDILPDAGKCIAYGLADAPKFNRSVVSFGDGYEQRARKGINNVRGSWSVTWQNIKNADGDTLAAFLNARGGVAPFRFEHPVTGVEHTVVCDEPPHRSYDVSGRSTLTATFREVFG